MKYRYLPMLAGIALYTGALYSGVSCAGTGAELWPEEIIDSMDGRRLVLFLPNKDIADSPQWMPADGAAPPLNIAGAMAQLKEWMAGDPRYREAEIHEIKLQPIRQHEKENRWYYLFQLRRHDGDKRKVIYAAVLLNGKVVPVLVEPASIK
jgi:hypothetical protein